MNNSWQLICCKWTFCFSKSLERIHVSWFEVCWTAKHSSNHVYSLANWMMLQKSWWVLQWNKWPETLCAMKRLSHPGLNWQSLKKQWFTLLFPLEWWCYMEWVAGCSMPFTSHPSWSIIDPSWKRNQSGQWSSITTDCHLKRGQLIWQSVML